MKLHLASPAGRNLFTGYGAGYVAVNNVRYDKSLIVTPERIVENWQAAGWQDLNAGHFEMLLSFEPQIVLLGTGCALRFPRPALSRSLTEAGIGLEVMDTTAACRTYNILAAEGRNVVAAVLLG